MAVPDFPTAPAACTALDFGGTRRLLKAGELLRRSGFPVLAVPRRVQACGVLLLVGTAQVSVACALLAEHGLTPMAVLRYPLEQPEVLPTHPKEESPA